MGADMLAVTNWFPLVEDPIGSDPASKRFDRIPSIDSNTCLNDRSSICSHPSNNTNNKQEGGIRYNRGVTGLKLTGAALGEPHLGHDGSRRVPGQSSWTTHWTTRWATRPERAALTNELHHTLPPGKESTIFIRSGFIRSISVHGPLQSANGTTRRLVPEGMELPLPREERGKSGEGVVG